MRKGMLMAACLAVLAAGAFGQDKKIVIKFGYEPGTFVMTIKTDMDNVTTMSTGQTMNQKIEATMVMELEASPKDADGSQSLRMTFKRMIQSVSGGPVSMSYDSADPSASNPMLDNVYKAILDKPIEMKIDKDGKVVAMKGMDAMWDAMAAENPSMAPMVKGMKEQLGDKYLSQIVDWGYRMAPSGPVGVGETWDTQQQLDLPMIGSMQVNQKSTLKELKDSPKGPIAVIAFASTLEKSEPTKVEPGGSVTMTIDSAKIAQTGTSEMAVNSGMVHSYSIDQKVAMKMAMAGPAQPAGPEGGQGAPQSMTMDMQQTGKVEMTMKEGKYVPPPPPAPAATPAPAAAPVAPVAQ